MDHHFWLFLYSLPLPPAPKSLDFPSQELGMGRKEQGGPDFGMFLILCAPPSFPGPGLLLPNTAPSGAVPKGCHGVMSNRSCPGRLTSCLPFPQISLPREPFPARRVQILCLLTVRLSSGVTPQSWSGEEVHFPALERPSMDSFTSCGMKEGRSSAARASSPCMLYLWKFRAGQQA